MARTLLVWAKELGPDGPGGKGEVRALYCGENGVEADRVYRANKLNGAFEYVRLCYSVTHNIGTTPGRDGCPVVKPDAEMKEEKEEEENPLGSATEPVAPVAPVEPAADPEARKARSNGRRR